MKIVKPAEITKDWIDYSSLETFMTCPRKYWWRHSQGVTQAEDSAALINGTAFHEAIATYHFSRMEGKSWEHSMITGLEKGMEIMRTISNPDAKRNVSTFVEICTSYFQRWANDQFKVESIEIGGAVDLDEFLYAFRLDLLGQGPFGRCVMDHKTTSIVGSRWNERGKPNLQLEGYMFAASVLTGQDYLSGCLDIIPIYDLTAKKKEPPFRIYTIRTKEELAIWHENIVGWFKKVHECREDQFFPMNTERCVPLLGYSCDYQPLCQMYPNPHNLPAYELPAEFKVQFWSPFEGLEGV